MMHDKADRLKDIHTKLIKMAQSWAGKKAYDSDLAKALREEAILINHEHYLKNIPIYKKLAEEEGVKELKDTEVIKKDLMSTDDIFKSYNQTWLDSNDFNQMNKWLGSIFHQRIDIDVDGVKSIDQWIDRLMASGITSTYSSGTTGRFSFVPRCDMSWNLFTVAPAAYLGPILMDLGLGSFIQNLLIGPAIKLLSPETLANTVKKLGLPGYSGVFMSFRKGNMGIQLVGQELSKMFKRNTFLYDIDLSASALRLISRGAKNEEDQKLIEDFQNETMGKKEENYMKIISRLKNITTSGQKAFMFGAPYQLKELMDLMEDNNEKIALKRKSVVFFGGGWKSFEGEKIDRETLVEMISEKLDVPGELVIEGYSMTEVNGLMIRCNHGRFHIPPVIEPVILNEELLPLEGYDLKGAFGFLDPFAISYPGFIISGDNVRLQDDLCPCGMHGPTLSEIGRAPGREVKGCGGIMASVQA
ncbi:MAG: hypothetical protein GY864_02615 [Desulfobacterales bacterium]|nr:hypothetical protein [Desulfobacterales bacterium]